MQKLHIKKGDLVKVIAGANKGKEGKVLSVVTDKNQAFIEGVNLVSRHTKPSTTNPQGGIIEKEAPIHLSNLMLIDPKTGVPTRVGRKKDNGKIVRYSKKSGEVIQ